MNFGIDNGFVLTYTAEEGEKTAVIPEGIIGIGQRAFADADMEKIELPEGLEKLESEAFSGCKALTELHVPAAVTSISTGAFSGCAALTRVWLPERLSAYGEHLFSACPALRRLDGVSSGSWCEYDPKAARLTLHRRGGETGCLLAGCFYDSNLLRSGTVLDVLDDAELEWKDVDFTKNIISIRRSSLYLPDRGTFEDETKNNSSRRVIRVPASAMELLKTYRHWQLEQQMSAVDIWQNTGKIFTAADGTPMHPDVLSGWFHDFIRTTDLPPIHLHSLRHTNATLAIANGIAVTTVAGQLGHASPTTTMKIYAHAIQSAQAAAADMMDELLKMPTSKPKRGRPRKAI